MPISDWNRSEDWEILFLAGRRCPGVARVTITMDGGLDVKKPKKAKKARVVDEGVHPATVQIELELMSDELDEFEQELVPILRPRPRNGSRQPVNISHPEARLWGVNVVMVGDISSPSPRAGGTKTISIKCIEWTSQLSKIKKQKDKPDGNEDAGWDVNKYTDELRPSKSRAAFEALE